MFKTVLREQYGLRLEQEERASLGAGSHVWFLRCEEGEYVLKFPSGSEINHPQAEPKLCSFLRQHGIPACDFLKNKTGGYISHTADGRLFTVQRRFSGVTPEWNSASQTLLTESAELLGKIHRVLREHPALPTGIGADFFENMTPQRATESYKRSLETAVRLGDDEIADELKWRIDFVSRLPKQRFDLDRLTLSNTHGDYFISQFICEKGHMTAVIDWTSACVHPVIWEIMRSFAYGAPCCGEGKIDEKLFKKYLEVYCRYGELNDYDRENLYRLYFYQLAVCDYYGQYYASLAPNRHIYLRQAQHATRLLKGVYPFDL